MPPSPIPPNINDDDPVGEAVSYFQLEQRRGGETKLGGQPLPKLPPSSPWSSDPCGDEPPVDRREDGDVFQREDFFEPTTEPTIEGDE
jgi:hypothetical protein